MPKRLTISGKWGEVWFMNLSPQAKLIYLYILDNCDFIGVYEYNEVLMNVQIGFSNKVNIREHIEKLESKIEWFRDGQKLWVVNYIKEQYGVLNNNSSIHRSVLNELKRYFLDEKNNGERLSCLLKTVSQLFVESESKNGVGYVYPTIYPTTEKTAVKKSQKNESFFLSEKDSNNQAVTDARTESDVGYVYPNKNGNGKKKELLRVRELLEVSNSKSNGELSKKSTAEKKKFSIPSSEEVHEMMALKSGNSGVDVDYEASQFMDYYESNGWMVGRNKMKSWRHSVQKWIRDKIHNKVKHSYEESKSDINAML